MNIRRSTAIVAAGLLTVLALQAFPASAAPTRYEAENCTISAGTVDTNHLNFSGTGFVNGDNAVGNYLECTINAANAGSATFGIRYSNGTTTGRPADISVNGTTVNRPMDISVNGNSVALDLAFNATTNWDTWADQTISVTLTAGSNKVRATATTANGGPNLDRLRVTGQNDSEAPTAPGQPSCANITENSIDLSWGASTDNVGVVGYDIYHDGNLLSQSAGTGTSKPLTGLTPNTQYRLSVFAKDAAGNVSLSSPQAFCTTLASSDVTPPSAPTNLTFSNLSSAGVTLTWGASTDTVGVVAYDVRAGTTVVKSVTGNPPATSTSVTSLACNTAYTLNLVARDLAGNVSAQSNTVPFTTRA